MTPHSISKRCISTRCALLLCATALCACRPAATRTAAPKTAAAQPTPSSTEVAVAEVVVGSGTLSAPFTVTVRGAGEVEPGASASIEVKVEAHTDCLKLKTGVRGIDGVRVSLGAPRGHGRVRAGESVRRTVEAVADPGVAGLLAIDIRCSRAQGIASTTAAVRFHARGARDVMKTLGRIVPDPEGGPPMEVMEAEVR